MVQFVVALKRPFSDMKKLLLGMLFSIIPVVNFLALGYSLSCAKSAMDKKKTLPEWENFGNLFLDGVLYLVLGVLYFVPLLLVFMLFGGSFHFFNLASGMAPVFATGFGLGMILLSVFFLLTLFVFPVAVVTYAKNRKFAEALQFTKIIPKAFNSDYFLAWIMVMLYSVILMSVGEYFSFVGTGIASFLVGVTSMTLFGELFNSL